MTALHKEIFELFKEAATNRGVYPYAILNADQVFEDRFLRWSDWVSATRVALPHNRDRPLYDTAWVFPRMVRPLSSAGKNYSGEMLIVAMDQKTGRLAILQRDVDFRKLDQVLQPESVAATIHQNIRLVEGSRSSITEFLEKAEKRIPLLKTTMHAVDSFESSHKKLKTPKNNRSSLNSLAFMAGTTVLGREQDNALSEINGLIKHNAMTFAESLWARSDKQYQKNYFPLQIYNFLTQAKTPQAMDYRMGALQTVAPMHWMSGMSPDFWRNVDAGMPILQATAQEIDCKPSTVRNVLRKADIYSSCNFDLVARALDAHDVAKWPTDKQELDCFLHVRRLAEYVAKTFERDAATIVDQWHKENKKRGGTTWEEILIHQLKPHMATVDERNSRKKKRLTLLAKSLYARRAESTQPGKGLYKDYMDAYHSNLEHIADMKRDIIKGLIRPALLLNIESRPDIKIGKVVMEEMEQTISNRIWRSAPPSEQLAASGYWHSPRINFTGRFRSVAFSSNQTWSWRTLLDAPLKLGKVTFHPLDSSAALQEESDNMHHCVWSYTYNCMSRGYHIFSLRNGSGARLSTLTVEDCVQDGQRQVKFSQHKAMSNHAPSDDANYAADQFIEKINKGEITPDWRAVDESKAEFLKQELSNSVGYDFHDPVQQDRILALYKPCLPREVSRCPDFGSFALTLRIEDTLKDFGFLRPQGPLAAPPQVPQP